MASIVVVDDEQAIRNSVQRILATGGHEVQTAATLAEFHEIMDGKTVEVVLLDVHLPDGRGDDVVPDLLARDPYLKVVVISGDATVDTTQSAIRRGAFDYLTKPFNAEALRHVVSQAVGARLEAVNRSASERSPIRSITSQRRLAGFSRQICVANLAIDRAAKATTPVLVEGESGTGKEMSAQAVHELSDRCSMPFVKVNCAAIPRPLVESELFGHEIGAFPGAKETRKGYMELADGGTLFLDEIGDLPMAAQEKLGRLIDEGVFLRLGADKPRKVDVRIIAATSSDLQGGISRGTFLRELGVQLAANVIQMPPLRNHPDDIEHLAYIFLREKSLELNRKIYGFTEGVLDFFREYTWPGNVRELKNVVERLVILSDPETIQVDEECLRRYSFNLRGTGATPTARAELGVDLDDFGLDNGNLVALEELEKNYLRKALRTLNFNKTQCAQQLGISRSTLQRKIQQYGLE